MCELNLFISPILFLPLFFNDYLFWYATNLSIRNVFKMLFVEIKYIKMRRYTNQLLIFQKKYKNEIHCRFYSIHSTISRPYDSCI